MNSETNYKKLCRFIASFEILNCSIQAPYCEEPKDMERLIVEKSS